MKPDVYAQILNSVVVNTLLATTGLDVFDPTYVWVVITNVIPQPAIGWSYDGTNFTAPPSQPIPPVTPPQPLQVTVQVSDPAAQAVLSDILSSIINSDPSYVQKYIVNPPVTTENQ
jgi:hypothetical protein